MKTSNILHYFLNTVKKISCLSFLTSLYLFTYLLVAFLKEKNSLAM